MKHIRTRYAPSPTGYLHIGGARTALLSYLYAKHFNGEFIIRIEDTDLERNIKDGEDSQIDNLIWLGVIPDESPRNENKKYGKYRQSEKLNRYQVVVEELIKNGKAYRAFDTPEELERQKSEKQSLDNFNFHYDPHWLKITDEEREKRLKNHQYVVRLKVTPNKIYEWYDLVRENIAVNSNEITDFVIQKQNGYPTYNFAVVVDDFDMEITHVLRGAEHITNTPKQLAIYDALNWTPPSFGHLTIITNNEGKKLSKRDYSIKQFIEDYKNIGYPSIAIFNFLALLGWSDIESKEIMTKEEIIKRFDGKRFAKSPTIFNMDKMIWFAKSHMKMMKNDDIIKHLNIPTTTDKQWLEVFLNIYKEGVSTFTQFQELFDSYQNLSVKSQKERNEIVTFFAQELNQKPFSIENIKLAIEKTKQKTNKKGKELFMPLRQAITYKDQGPELATDIWLMGEKIVKARLK